jgi:protein pelota
LKERYDHLLHIQANVPGKNFETKRADAKRKEYHKKIIDKIKKEEKKVKKILIAGPGFTKEDIRDIIKSREKDLLGKLMVNSTYQTGKLGLQELMKKGLLEKLGKMSRIEEETKAVESLLEQMGKEGKAVLKDNINDAVGSLQILLVSDKRIRDFEELLDKADELKIKIMVISSEHPAGERLMGLGGIAGIKY